MANIKPLDQSKEKFSKRASAAGPEYLQGVENPRVAWNVAAKESEPNYKAGVIAAANAGRYGKGVTKAGEDKWKKNAIAKGPQRYAEGVSLAKEDWAAGFSPYQSAIAALKLPPRGPRRSAQNLQRVALVVQTNGQLFESLSKG